MPLFRCSHCKTELEATKTQAGKRVTCPECGEKIIVPGAAAPQRKAPPRRDEEDDEPREPSRRPGAKGAPRETASSGNKGLLIGLGVGGGVTILGLVALVVVLLTREPKPTEVAEAPRPAAPKVRETANPAPKETPAKAAATPEKEKEKAAPAEVAKKAEPTLPVMPSGGPASANEVYQYTLKSVALIFVPHGNLLSQGTGTLVDRTNRLVLTNYHVVAGSKVAAVLFPMYHPDGRLITEKETYLTRLKKDDVFKGTVVAQDAKRDLALIQLDRVAEGIEPMRLAPSNPPVGQKVYGVGNPGVSSALWLLTEGTVRQVSRKKWAASGGDGQVFEFDAEVVESSSPTNAGDSGGPQLNDRGEQVGVTQGGVRAIVANSISYFISLQEISDFMRGHYLSASLSWPPEARAALVAKGPGPREDQVPDFIKALEHSDPSTRAKAAQALGIAGANARMAIPPLMKLLKDPEDYVRRVAEESLIQIGAPARADLLALQAGLRDKGSPETRRYAAAALGLMGPEARSAITTLVEAVRDPEGLVRQAAARSLGKMGTDAKDAVFPALQTALQDTDRTVRTAAAESLGTCGRFGSGDVNVLQGLLEHQDAEARAQAARCLGQVGAPAKAALPNLLRACKDPDGTVRSAALDGALSVTTDKAAQLPLLKEALTDTETTVRRVAVARLARLGADAKPASSALVAVLKDGDKEVRKSAIAALAKIGPSVAKEAVPALADLLRDSEVDVLSEAAGALAVLGPDPKATAVAGLVELLGHEEAGVRTKATQALVKIGKQAVPALITALNDERDAKKREQAAVTLGDIGHDARAAIQILRLRANNDAAAPVRAKATEALRKVQPPGKR
jgi:HEAT repeat protein/S1-C subfamily serine protease/DNA-directed RNA polymerase subunit RPC12/RpoP